MRLTHALPLPLPHSHPHPLPSCPCLLPASCFLLPPSLWLQVYGRLDTSKILSILPKSDLLTVCSCGSSAFVEDVKALYLRLGLPRPLFTVVA